MFIFADVGGETAGATIVLSSEVFAFADKSTGLGAKLGTGEEAFGLRSCNRLYAAFNFLFESRRYNAGSTP